MDSTWRYSSHCREECLIHDPLELGPISGSTLESHGHRFQARTKKGANGSNFREDVGIEGVYDEESDKERWARLMMESGSVQAVEGKQFLTAALSRGTADRPLTRRKEIGENAHYVRKVCSPE
jgi:hypothetical protein